MMHFYVPKKLDKFLDYLRNYHLFKNEFFSLDLFVIPPCKATTSRARTGTWNYALESTEDGEFSVVWNNKYLCRFCIGELVEAHRSPAGNKRRQVHTIIWKDRAATVLLHTTLSSGVKLTASK
jgi:hypothetical protein